MSAAATAAGYLYASGRLRGKSKDNNEQEHHHAPAPERKRVRIAALPEREPEPLQAAPAVERPRRTPRIEYKVRRWRAE
jgi:hypothetical protein